MKLTEILAEDRRLRPALITMKRGTIIRPNHARFVIYPSGNTILVAGFGKGSGPIVSDSGNFNSNDSVVRKLRDFFGPPTYLNCEWQDPSGWHEPLLDDDGLEAWYHDYNTVGTGGVGPDGYSAHKQYAINPRFDRVITIRKHNIQSIEWL